MAKYMADKVRNFILSYGFVIFSFDFIPIINLKILQSAKEEFMHAQPNKYLEELGMESVSTLYNNYSLISVLIGIVILHLGISLLFSWSNEQQNWIQKFIAKIYRLFTFTIYIRMFIEAFLFLLLSSMFEVRYYLYDDKSTKHSFIAACWIIFLWIWLVLISIISWLANKNTLQIDDKCLTCEFYNGIKQSKTTHPTRTQLYSNQSVYNQPKVSSKVKRARLYSFIFLMRRLVQVALIVYAIELHYVSAILAILILQVVYTIAIVYMNSFESK